MEHDGTTKRKGRVKSRNIYNIIFLAGFLYTNPNDTGSQNLTTIVLSKVDGYW